MLHAGSPVGIVMRHSEHVLKLSRLRSTSSRGFVDTFNLSEHKNDNMILPITGYTASGFLQTKFWEKSQKIIKRLQLFKIISQKQTEPIKIYRIGVEWSLNRPGLVRKELYEKFIEDRNICENRLNKLH